ncbi:hypothetical protein A2U01_0044208, partial [Trifolium medium]|nr:hypothetical protein [Trifolium medium]
PHLSYSFVPESDEAKALNAPEVEVILLIEPKAVESKDMSPSEPETIEIEDLSSSKPDIIEFKDLNAS